MSFNGATCDVNQLKTDAKAYASKASDPLLSLIGNVPAALKLDGGTPGTASTDNALDILARIAFIRGSATLQKLDVTGPVFDRLVKGTIQCMKSDVYAGATEPTQPGQPTGFGPALKSGWVFEVRGKSTDPAGGAYERNGTGAASWWAAWPRTGTWADAIQSTLTQDRVFIYGYQTSSSLFTGRLGSSFEHFTIPRIQRAAVPPDPFTLSARLGLCFADANQIAAGARVNHAKVFLTLPATPVACDGPFAFSETSGSLVMGMVKPTVQLARRAAGYFWPQPLQAAALFAGGSVTGTPDDFSPSAVWNLSLFQLGGLGTIGDGVISAPLHLFGSTAPVTLNVNIVDGTNTVQAPDGTPVVVSIVGNSSSIAFFSDSGKAAAPTVTRYSVGGVVSYADVKLTKAGGYQLQFQVTFDNVVGGNVVTSNSFNMQNK